MISWASLVVGAAALGLPGRATADDTVPVDVPASAPVEAPSEVPSVAALEEVVVTAQKRAESLQDAPISIAAFNSDALEQRGISSVEDLGGNVPGMTLAPFPTQATALRIFIRGVGLNESQVTMDPAVGVYQDGIYIARSSGLALDLSDLERIEVLRGPQGTLYGRNTTGGAVNLVTRKPDPSGFWARTTLGFGERNQGLVKGVVNVPVTDDAAVKLSALGKRQDGFVENDGPGDDYGDSEAWGVRVDARWLPTEWLTVDYGFDHTHSKQVGPGYQAVLHPDSNKGTANLIKGYAQLNTVYASRMLDHLATGASLEPSTNEIDGHALTLTMPIGALELKYIGAYRELVDDYYADLGGGAGSTTFRLDNNAYDGPAATQATGGPVPLVIPRLKQDQWSHELQLSGKAFEEQVQFIVGAFAFTENGKDLTPYSHEVNSGLGPGVVASLAAAFPDLANTLLSLAGPDLVTFVYRDYRARNEALAGFAQTTWTPAILDERLHLTAGYRHSEDKRSATKTYQHDFYLEGTVGGLGTAIPLPPASGTDAFDHVHASRKFQDDAISLMAGFEVTDGVNAYAKYVEGYKSGGFNLRDPQVSGASGAASDGTDYGYGFTDGFAPEHVTATEVGVKSEWFGRRLRVNADVFNSEYRDMQVNFLIPGTLGDTKTTNAGKARIRGLEIESVGVVSSWLRLSAEYSYLDAKVQEVRDIQGNDVADDFPFPSAPKHSGVAAADVSVPAGGWGEVRAYLAYAYTDRRNGGGLPGRTDLSYLPSFEVVNARIGLDDVSLGSGSLGVAIFGRNLLDEEYPVDAVPTFPHTDRAVLWGEPRMFGVELTYQW